MTHCAIKEHTAGSILTPSRLPEADFVINPYTGCVHGCLYCYARFMKRFSGQEAAWGDFLVAKTNAPDLVPVQSRRYEGKRILLSSVTDPYLPAEEHYRLTRRVLEKLIPLKPSLSVLTKSALVTRDIDLFLRFEHCEVGMTITSNDDVVREKLEPLASSVEARFAALKELKARGVKTYAFIGPVLPFLTDWKEILGSLRETVDCFWFESLNFRGSARKNILSFIEKNYSYLHSEYEEIIKAPRAFWAALEQEIRTFCDFEKLNYKIFFKH